jgi:hypothetical protein
MILRANRTDALADAVWLKEDLLATHHGIPVEAQRGLQ